MKKKLRHILHNNSGFSALQNIMIAVIVIILIAVAGYAFYGYIQSSYQVKAENTARKIYGAAKDYLLDKEAGGALEEFNQSARKYGGPVDLDNEKSILKSIYDGKDFDSFFETFKYNYRDVPIRYLLLESASVEQEDRELNPILEMLEYSIPDDNIKKHSILIEYNGNTGAVLAVLYSEKIDSFTYIGETDQRANALLRDEKSLEQKWQGYYGIDPEEL